MFLHCFHYITGQLRFFLLISAFTPEVGYNMVMIIWGIVTWWYTDGWRQCLLRMQDRIAATLDFFSFGLLVGTLFAPFRQISAGKVGGSFEVQVRAFLDQLISRAIGMVVRLITIAIGSVAVLIDLLVAIVLLIGWLFVPLLPFIGLGLFILEWLPWSK